MKFFAAGLFIAAILGAGYYFLAPKEEKPEEQVCIQVITSAKNPETGEVKEFPTPCDIPQGWEVIQNNAQTMPNGLIVQDIAVGQGKEAIAGSAVSVHYTGTLQNGTKFDSSLDRGQPFSFTLGQNSVIQGWEQGIIGMKEGGKRKLTIPPELGYGQAGAGNIIPPNATLLFDVELLQVN